MRMQVCRLGDRLVQRARFGSRIITKAKLCHQLVFKREFESRIRGRCGRWFGRWFSRKAASRLIRLTKRAFQFGQHVIDRRRRFCVVARTTQFAHELRFEIKSITVRLNGRGLIRRIINGERCLVITGFTAVNPVFGIFVLAGP